MIVELSKEQKALLQLLTIQMKKHENTDNHVPDVGNNLITIKNNNMTSREIAEKL